MRLAAVALFASLSFNLMVVLPGMLILTGSAKATGDEIAKMAAQSGLIANVADPLLANR